MEVEIDVENTDSDDIREKKVNKFNNTNMANVKFISMDDKSESNYSRVLSEMVKKITLIRILYQGLQFIFKKQLKH